MTPGLFKRAAEEAAHHALRRAQIASYLLQGLPLGAKLTQAQQEVVRAALAEFAQAEGRRAESYARTARSA